jgi:phage FluMu protein Com
MDRPVLCPRCGTVSQGGVVLPPGAEPVLLEASGSSPGPYKCPVCKAIIPSDAQQESEDLVAPLLEIAKSNRELVHDIKDMAESLLK